jgi:beta-xylosidase
MSNFRIPITSLLILSILNTFGQGKTPISKPLVSHIYTADPSVHVFNGKIYIYPSHDVDSGTKEDDEGGHFNMKDYRILSMDSPKSKVKDNGIALDIKNVKWAGRQMWAPDAAYKNGTYYLYFPVKDKEDIFRIGVATSKSPIGPFKAETEPIKGTYSIDPAVFKDSDGNHYLYFGGIWGGQLQRWKSGVYGATDESQPANGQPALMAKVARLDANMKAMAEAPRNVQILDAQGKVLLSEDHDRRFFEAAFVHQYQGKYYFSYSTGDTQNIAYATGTSPYGPFTYQGVILKPVKGI